MLQVMNLQKKIGAKTILKDISFTVGAGEIALFLGGSGVGKSTLLRVLNNLELFDSGEILLDGKQLDLSKVSQEHTVGMVFQHYNLFEHLSVERNITLPLELSLKMAHNEARKIASELLDRYGLQDKATSSIRSLSGGQKQRAAIARTLALDPRIVCMDEPTSALDPVLTGQVAQEIVEIAEEGRSVLVSTHDMGLVKQLKATIFFMQHGTIVECLTRDDFEKNPDRYPAFNEFY